MKCMNCDNKSIVDSGTIALGVELKNMKRTLKFKVHFCEDCIADANEFMGEGLSELAGELASSEAGSELISDTGVMPHEM